MSREVASELWLPDKDVAIATEEDMSGAVQGQQGLALLGGGQGLPACRVHMSAVTGAGFLQTLSTSSSCRKQGPGGRAMVANVVRPLPLARDLGL